MSRWLAKYKNHPEEPITKQKNSPEMPIQRTDNTDTGNKVIDFQKEMQKRRDIFPYPLNETLGIGEWDPLDIKYVNGKPVLQPGWWRKIPKDEGDDGRGKE